MRGDLFLGPNCSEPGRGSPSARASPLAAKGAISWALQHISYFILSFSSLLFFIVSLLYLVNDKSAFLPINRSPNLQIEGIHTGPPDCFLPNQTLGQISARQRLPPKLYTQKNSECWSFFSACSRHNFSDIMCFIVFLPADI